MLLNIFNSSLTAATNKLESFPPFIFLRLLFTFIGKAGSQRKQKIGASSIYHLFFVTYGGYK